jgi:glycosyltransferase involved in cell wall biosynthesis
MISVIIPTFRRPSQTQAALKSVVNQKRGRELIQEIHLIDDGSNDGSLDLLKSELRKESMFWKNRLAIHEIPHHGVSYCRNLGIKNSSSPWLAFLDSDDQWLPHKCVSQIETLHSDGLLISHGEEIWIRRGRRVNPKKIHKKSGGWIFEPSLQLCLMSPSATIIHRSVFKRFGLFDESFEVCEDFDLWLRLTRALRVSFEKEPLLVKYGGHEDQLSTKFIGMDRWRVRSYLKLLDSGLLSPVQREKTLDALALKWNILELGFYKHGRLEDLASLKHHVAAYLDSMAPGRESRRSVF